MPSKYQTFDTSRLELLPLAQRENKKDDVASPTVAFSPDGKLIASGGWNSQNIKLFAVSGSETRVLSGLPGELFSPVAFSPDGRLVASGGCKKDSAGNCMNGLLKVWDVATGVDLAELPAGNNGAVTCLAFRPDGRMLAAGSADSIIRFWEIITTGAQ